MSGYRAWNGGLRKMSVNDFYDWTVLDNSAVQITRCKAFYLDRDSDKYPIFEVADSGVFYKVQLRGCDVTHDILVHKSTSLYEFLCHCSTLRPQYCDCGVTLQHKNDIEPKNWYKESESFDAVIMGKKLLLVPDEDGDEQIWHDGYTFVLGSSING